ncbi:MAG: threonine-phosphate decarboxylase CobD [Pseudomonadota bacterium]
MARREHGGDPRAALAQVEPGGRAHDDVLDLSTGINPVSYRFRPLSGSVWAALPAQGQMEGLLSAARVYYGLPDETGIAAAPGSQALIQLLPRIMGLSRARILGPTYNEHGHVWASQVDDVAEVDQLPDALPDGALVIVNPNNPDGRRTGIRQLEAAAASQTEAGGWLVVDEAFVDVEPDLSAVSLCPRFNVIVLKSFGKFFGLAGLRLGFAVASRSMCADIEAALGPWAISGPALSIGTEALANRPWQTSNRQRLAEDCGKLDHLLTERGLHVVGGTSLFRLVEAERAQDIYRSLLSAGIYVRKFAAHPRWLRFGVPDSAGLAQLRSAFGKISAR